MESLFCYFLYRAKLFHFILCKLSVQRLNSLKTIVKGIYLEKAHLNSPCQSHSLFILYLGTKYVPSLLFTLIDMILLLVTF